MLTISVLGPTELRRDGVRIPVASGKTQQALQVIDATTGVLIAIRDRL